MHFQYHVYKYENVLQQLWECYTFPRCVNNTIALINLPYPPRWIYKFAVRSSKTWPFSTECALESTNLDKDCSMRVVHSNNAPSSHSSIMQLWRLPRYVFSYFSSVLLTRSSVARSENSACSYEETDVWLVSVVSPITNVYLTVLRNCQGTLSMAIGGITTCLFVSFPSSFTLKNALLYIVSG
jgi:hypothetical protein